MRIMSPDELFGKKLNKKAVPPSAGQMSLGLKYFFRRKV